MKLELNRFLRGMHGVLDDVVYKRFEDGTISMGKPKKFEGPPTAAQLRVRTRFTEAASYATAVLADPDRRDVYITAAKEMGRNSVQSVAMADYLNLPRVHEIDLVFYNGHVGDPIWIIASDDFEVVTVKVRIKDANGTVLEEGLATKTDVRWVYLGKTNVPRDQNLLIEAEAADRAGHDTALSEIWHA